MSAIWLTSSGQASNTTGNLAASFVYTVVKHMGLCVQLTPRLDHVLWVNAIVQLVICLPGILGAALSLWITCLKHNRSSVSVQVALLSLYDLLYLAAALTLSILHLSGVTNHAVIGVCHFVRHLGLWGLTYTMVDITVERCISIARPFLARKMRRVTFTLQRSAVILVLGLILTLPFAIDFVFGFSEERECKEGRSLTTYGLVYNLYIALLLFYLLPYTWILAANARLIHALRQVGRHQPQGVTAINAGDSSASARQLSLFVVGLSLWYGACMLAPSILFLVRLTRVELFQPEKDLVAAAAAETLVVLSTAANFLFYFLMWRNFRHSFLVIFCQRCRSVDVNDGQRSTEDPASPRPLHLHNSVSAGEYQPAFQQGNTASTDVGDQ